MKKEQCKPGVAVTLDHIVVYGISRDQLGIPFSYQNTMIEEGIITKYRIVENNEHEYRYTIEFGKRKKIYLTRSKIGVMLTNGTLIYKYPEELERKTRQPK